MPSESFEKMYTHSAKVRDVLASMWRNTPKPTALLAWAGPAQMRALGFESPAKAAPSSCAVLMWQAHVTHWAVPSHLLVSLCLRQASHEQSFPKGETRSYFPSFPGIWQPKRKKWYSNWEPSEKQATQIHKQRHPPMMGPACGLGFHCAPLFKNDGKHNFWPRPPGIPVCVLLPAQCGSKSREWRQGQLEAVTLTGGKERWDSVLSMKDWTAGFFHTPTWQKVTPTWQ